MTVGFSALLAALAAGANALSSVLQRKAARKAPDDESLKPSLIADLLHRPSWFGGMGAMAAGFILQATALSIGGLLIVQPVLAFELPLTLFIGSRVLHSHISREIWLAAMVMAVGLGMLLVSAAPTPSQATLSPLEWVVGILGTVIPILLLTLVGRKSAGPRRAALLGVAAGAGFGLTAAIMDATTRAFATGVLSGLTAWQTYAMVVSGIGATYLLQSAFQAGRLAAAQPGITITDPVVASIWGLVLFGERARGGLFLIPEAVGGCLIILGVVILARSPMLASDSKRSEAASPTESGRSQ